MNLSFILGMSELEGSGLPEQSGMEEKPYLRTYG